MDPLKPGDVVVARRQLDKKGADVKSGTMGVVFEASEEGTLVRWMNMGICNVVPEDVDIIRS